MLVGLNVEVYQPHFYTNKEIEQLPVQIIGKVIESRHSGKLQRINDMRHPIFKKAVRIILLILLIICSHPSNADEWTFIKIQMIGKYILKMMRLYGLMMK